MSLLVYDDRHDHELNLLFATRGVMERTTAVVPVLSH